MRRSPLRLFTWFSRWTLGQGGLVRETVPSDVGPQVVWSVGQGAAVVFLHDVGAQAGVWAKTFTELPRGRFRMIVLDLAGHGESAPATGPLGIGTMISGLAATVRQLDRVVLVGHGVGAWLAMLYAGAHPDQVARVVVVGGGPLRGMRADVPLVPKDLDDARLLSAAVRATPAADYVLKDVVRSAAAGPLARWASAEPEYTELEAEERLAGFPVPVELVWGAADGLWPAEFADELARVLPESRLTKIDGCGHAPHEERPAEFAAVLAQVLERV